MVSYFTLQGYFPYRDVSRVGGGWLSWEGDLQLHGDRRAAGQDQLPYLNGELFYFTGVFPHIGMFPGWAGFGFRGRGDIHVKLHGNNRAARQNQIQLINGERLLF